MRARVWFLALCVIWVVSQAAADGVFIPSRAFPRTPSIPSQTAIIAFHGTTETLIIESTMSAEEGERFAWLLPLPALPTEFQAVSSGIMKVMYFCTAPEIIDEIDPPRRLAAFFVLVFSGLISGILASRDNKPRRDAFVVGLGAAFLLFLCCLPCMFVTVVTSSASSPSQAMAAETLRRERVGNYEVALLRARSSAEIQEWLRQNDFAPLDKKADQIVTDYCREGWLFAAARLVRTEKGKLTPHPLQVTFPSKKPVYPMRLTALAGSQTQVDLFVVSDKQWRHPDFALQFADSFYDVSKKYISYDLAWGNAYRRNLGQPDLLAILNDGDWITHLRAKLSSEQMGKDIVLTRHLRSEPFLKRVYTGSDAMKKAQVIFWLGAALTLPVGVWICRRRKWRVYYAIGGAGGMAVVFFVGRLVILPIDWDSKIVQDDPHDDEMQYEQIKQMVDKATDKETSPALVRALVAKQLAQDEWNSYTGEPMRESQDPGDFYFETDSSGTLHLKLPDAAGTPHDIQVLPRPDPAASKNDL